MSSTAAQRTYVKIREMLWSGTLRPGSRLSQSRVARQLGCSTIPVLEAFRRLESEGLISKTPRKMARVRELSAKDFEGLYLVRLGLESVTVRLCAQRASDEQIEKLQALEQQFETAVAAGDRAGVRRFEVELHHFIARCADCPLLEEEIERLLLIEQTAGFMEQDEPLPPEIRFTHRALVAAIADRDVDSAEYFMRKHIEEGLRQRLSLSGKKP
jgi:DNA-binding GntR family transcriptional regulator